jgi:hypothetical protein
MTEEVWIVSAARTAVGTFGGALKDVPLADPRIVAMKFGNSSLVEFDVEQAVLDSTEDADLRETRAWSRSRWGKELASRLRIINFHAHLVSIPKLEADGPWWAYRDA